MGPGRKLEENLWKVWHPNLLQRKQNIKEHPCVIQDKDRFQELECDDEYIGESTRTFGEGFKETSPIHGHQSTSGHPTTLDNFSMVDRERQDLAR